jgi:hypothetical protein
MKPYFIASVLALTLVASSVPVSIYGAEPPDYSQTASLLERIQTLLGKITGLQAEIAGSDALKNQPPIGYAGNIRGGIAHGWTLDPDEPSAKIGFHVYMDGPAGKGGTYVAGGRAGQNRVDIAPDKESYGHWYEFAIPDQYRDGKDHTLYVYGIDSEGLKGNNTLLKNNPKSFNISQGSIPPLFLPGDRVKTTANLNARVTPSIKGDIVGEEPKGSLGTIVGGPTNAGGYTWWQINYDNNVSGWSADTYLVEVSTPTSEDPSCTLTASPTSITTGNTSTLSWTSTNATSGSIDEGAGTMTPIASGSKSVSPTTSTLYTATVTGTGGSATCEASVDVTTGTLSKKGIAMPSKYSYSGDVINQLGVSWYYDWSINEITGAKPEFVPQIFGDGKDYQENIETLALGSMKVPILKTFNEPDLPGHYIAPTEAVKYWDDFINVAERVSSPGISYHSLKTGNSWVNDFMTEANAKNAEVDFISLHWFDVPSKADDLLMMIDNIHTQYNKPIWLDAFAVRDRTLPKGVDSNITEEEVIAFMKTVLQGLEDRPYVERYAWFGGTGEGNDRAAELAPSFLFDPDTGKLTKVGKFYAAWDPSGTTTLSQGDRVEATAILNVRATPSGSGTLVDTVPLGSLGTIVGGPTKTANYTFWQINYDNNISGWSVELYLAKTSTSIDTTKPTVSLTAPAASSTVSGTVTLSANASDNVGVTGVQFQVDGVNVGAEDTTTPYSRAWNTTTTVTNDTHNIRAVARDAAGNTRSTTRSVAVSNTTTTVPRSVIHDPTYQSGFSVRTPESVLSYTTSNLYPFGNNNNSKPDWSSGQWGSQYPFSSTTPKTVLANGAVEYKTPGKRVVLGPGNYVLLGLNSIDWGSHIQRLGTPSSVKGFLSLDPEQHRQDDIPISQLESVQYKMSFRLVKAETGGPGSGGAHAQANLRLVNNNPSSPGYKEWVYFIIKLYDNRYRTIPYQLKKDGGTGALLYRLPSSDFYGNKSAWDKQWITIDKDILPMFAKAIQTGYSKRYLKSNDLGDYVPRFTGVHWEMSALKNVEMEFKDFDMILTPKPGVVLGASTIRSNPLTDSMQVRLADIQAAVAALRSRIQELY